MLRLAEWLEVDCHAFIHLYRHGYRGTQKNQRYDEKFLAVKAFPYSPVNSYLTYSKAQWNENR